MTYRRNDISEFVNKFQSTNSPNNRYASFDYCYGFFKNSSSDSILGDIEKSCLVVGFYLASWGMFRGSSFLLERSVKHFQPLIEYVASLDKSIWEIDVDNYNDKNIDIILNVYADCKACLINDENRDLTLVTKTLLGIFGIVPAFDDYFCTTFREIFRDDCRFRSFNKNALSLIKRFYDGNQEEIDLLHKNTNVIDFLSGRKTTLLYPRAKIIDMYGFAKGLPTVEATPSAT